MNPLKFACRQLLKSPGFTLVAVLTLALGIGANTAIFSVMDRLLVRPLPVAAPDRLALVGEARPDGQTDFFFNYPLFLDYQRDNTVFRELSAVAELNVGLGTGGATERQRALLVSANYFTMLGVGAALGRTFAPDEDAAPDGAPVAVLSHGLWQRGFGADPGVIGRPVTLNGRSLTVVGVAPPEFTGTSRGTAPDLYLPITLFGLLNGPLQNGESPLGSRFFIWHQVIGRLKDGVTHTRAQEVLQELTRRYHENRPPNTPETIALRSGAQGFTHQLRETRLPMNLLMGTSALVLLIACANLANLQLARASGRVREVAIRLALGAGRGRVVRELLTESLLLAGAGGALGLGVAVGLEGILERFRSAQGPSDAAGGLDLRVLLFALVASGVTGVLFGLAPALRASRPELVPELKGVGGGEPRTRRWNLRGTLVVLQVALSLLVLVCAGLCMRSLAKLQHLHPGFEPSRAVLMSVDLGLNNYTRPRAAEFFDRLLERARALPGVEAAGLGLTTPLSGNTPGMSLERAEGYEPAQPSEHPVGDVNIVTPDFFRALGVPLLRGRFFHAADAAGGPPVVIVNEAFARRYWPGQEAVGRRVWQHGPDGPVETEVVGVVGSTHSRRLTDAPRPAFYFPLAQKSEVAMTLVVRTGLNPADTIARLRELVKSLDANLPVFGIRTLAQQRDGSLALQRMAAMLLGGFGALALLLAALGIYGVLACSVSRRTREIGVRMALGAQVSDVLGLVLRQGAVLTVAGMLLGLAGAAGATRLLRGFLHEVPPLDPPTFGGVVALLAAVALLACWLPARRAARVDPMTALRTE